MKKKFSIRLICLLVAGTVLSGALAVSAFNGSPYEVLKDAVFNAMFYDNYTLETEFTLRVNGELIDYEREFAIQSASGSLTMSDDQFNFQNNELRLSKSQINVDSMGRQWYSVATRDPRWVGSSNWSDSLFGSFGLGEGDRNSSYMRLYELFIDLMVGDLRNNMYMTPQGDGIRRVSGAITGSQLPEIVRVLIDIAIESNYGGAASFTPRPNQNSWEMPVRDLTINRIFGTADIDSEGNLLYLLGGANVTLVNVLGEVNVLEAEFAMTFSDIGTSHPQVPVAGVAELFTPAFMYQNFESRYTNVMFRLDEYGNIYMGTMGTHADIRNTGVVFPDRSGVLGG
ncbi:MAG: hypothetical protein FWF80_01680 [Defluviitaleaceae bacterium]|nr:hypothetical protein [Defluviitaleaceae bacterium]